MWGSTGWSLGLQRPISGETLLVWWVVFWLFVPLRWVASRTVLHYVAHLSTLHALSPMSSFFSKLRERVSSLCLDFCGVNVYHVWVSAWLLWLGCPVVASYVTCEVLVRETIALLSEKRLLGLVTVGFVSGSLLPFLQGDRPGLSTEHFTFDSIF